MPKNTNRITYIDIAKGFAIIGVVIIHLFGAIASFDPKPFHKPVVTFFNGTMLVAFFILSGMTMRLSHDLDKSFKGLVARKFKALMVPYFAFSLINMVHEAGKCFVGINTWDTFSISSLLFKTLTLQGISVLWFLSTLFGAELLFAGVYKSAQKPVTRLIIIVAAIVAVTIGRFCIVSQMGESIGAKVAFSLALYAMRVALATCCLMIGYELIAWLESPAYKLNRVTEGVLGVAALAVSIVLVVTGLSGESDFNLMIFTSIPGFVVTALMASAGLILLSRAIKHSRPIEFIGRNSLIIMLTHMEFSIIYYSVQVAYILNTYVNHAKVYVLYLSIFLFVALLQYLVILLVNSISKLVKYKRS